MADIVTLGHRGSGAVPGRCPERRLGRLGSRRDGTRIEAHLRREPLDDGLDGCRPVGLGAAIASERNRRVGHRRR